MQVARRHTTKGKIQVSDSCLFCRIAAGEIPADIVYQDDDVLAFRDIAPKAPLHVLIIPRKHIASLNEAEPGDTALLGKVMLTAAQLAAYNEAARLRGVELSDVVREYLDAWAERTMTGGGDA